MVDYLSRNRHSKAHLTQTEKDLMLEQWDALTDEERDKYMRHADKGKFKPEYCDMLVEWMAAGNTYETFAVGHGIDIYDTADWECRYPEWWRKKKLAFKAALLFYENILKEALTEDVKTNAKLLIFKLSNAFPDTYRQGEGEASGSVNVYIDTGIRRDPAISAEYREIVQDTDLI